MTHDSTSSPRALIVGEALVDLIKRADDPNEPVGHPGGSPYNVALTLGRLGQNVQLVTALADDDHGRQLTQRLHDSNVRYGAGTHAIPRTSTSLALLDEAGSASYVFEMDWTLPGGVPLGENTAFIHGGSISATEPPGAAVVLDTLRKGRARSLVSYDPNIRPTIMPPREETVGLVEQYVEAADLVKVSDEDLEWLYPGEKPEVVVQRWFENAPVALVVVTAGKGGPSAWTRGGVRVARKPDPVTVVDTVGAGDSFMGGLLDALWRRNYTFREGADRLASIDEDTLTGIIDEVNQVANVTVSRAGANPPWASELGR